MLAVAVFSHSLISVIDSATETPTETPTETLTETLTGSLNHSAPEGRSAPPGQRASCGATMC